MTWKARFGILSMHWKKGLEKSNQCLVKKIKNSKKWLTLSLKFVKVLIVLLKEEVQEKL